MKTNGHQHYADKPPEDWTDEDMLQFLNDSIDMSVMEWQLLHPAARPIHLGYIPGLLNANDPAPAREQFNRNYIGGWRPFHGFRLRNDNWLISTVDPPVMPIASTKLRDELIILYVHGWVAIIQPDRSFEVCRMD
jgi:hypothetical protein